MDDLERLRRDMERQRGQRIDEAALPKQFCIRGHIQPLGQHNISNSCHKCSESLISHCACGQPFNLWYDFKPGYLNRVIAGRDVCSRCQMLTPWAARWLFRACDEDFSPIELDLLRHVEGYPKPESYGLSPHELSSKFHASFLDFLLRRGISIHEQSHPKHRNWLSYKSHLSTFINHYLQFRRSRASANKKALEKVATWRSLTGREFEVELGRILRNQGYSVTHVGGRGDNGADLLIEKAGKRIVVQCKAHAKRIGPGPVRDLKGCLDHHRASEGWLVSLEGYSDAAFQFAHLKPIRLLTIADFLDKKAK